MLALFDEESAALSAQEAAPSGESGGSAPAGLAATAVVIVVVVIGAVACHHKRRTQRQLSLLSEAGDVTTKAGGASKWPNGVPPEGEVRLSREKPKPAPKGGPARAVVGDIEEMSVTVLGDREELEEPKTPQSAQGTAYEAQ